MDWLIPTAAVALLAFAAVSARLEGSPVTAPMAFTLRRPAPRREGLDLVDPSATGETVAAARGGHARARAVRDAARIDLRALRREYVCRRACSGSACRSRSPPGLAALALFGSLSGREALLLAIVLAPTDAALGQAVVTNRALPSRVRQGLNVESGLNDGICVPMLPHRPRRRACRRRRSARAHAVALLAEEIGYGVLAASSPAPARPPRSWSARRRAADRRRPGCRSSRWQALRLPTAPRRRSAARGFIAAFVGGAVFGGLRRDDERGRLRLTEELGGCSTRDHVPRLRRRPARTRARRADLAIALYAVSA